MRMSESMCANHDRLPHLHRAGRAADRVRNRIVDATVLTGHGAWQAENGMKTLCFALILLFLFVQAAVSQQTKAGKWLDTTKDTQA
jgi:hypothetical protein